MTTPAPIFAGEEKAARLLDLRRDQFRELVQKGALPKPYELGDLKRWDVVELRAIIRGEKAEMGGMEW